MLTLAAMALYLRDLSNNEFSAVPLSILSVARSLTQLCVSRGPPVGGCPIFLLLLPRLAVTAAPFLPS